MSCCDGNQSSYSFDEDRLRVDSLSRRQRKARLSHGDLVVEGSLAGSEDDDLVRFRPDIPGPPPLEGASVTLDYEGREGAYRFKSTLLRAGEVWTVAPPQVVRISALSAAHRYHPMGDREFRLRLSGPWEAAPNQLFPILDVSTTGISFLFWPHLTPAELGTVLEGHLMPSGLGVFAVKLRVVNTRPIWEGASRMVAGCELVDLPATVQHELWRRIRSWRRRRMVA